MPSGMALVAPSSSFSRLMITDQINVQVLQGSGEDENLTGLTAAAFDSLTVCLTYVRCLCLRGPDRDDRPDQAGLESEAGHLRPRSRDRDAAARDQGLVPCRADGGRP